MCASVVNEIKLRLELLNLFCSNSRSQPQNEIKLSAALLGGSVGDTWLERTRSFVLVACRKPSFSGHVGLMEVVLKYQLQEAPEQCFKPIEVMKGTGVIGL